MKQEGKKQIAGQKDRLLTVILIVVLIVGIAILLYPSVSN